jgi:carbonic anhydrase
VIPAREALERLKEGNARFASGNPRQETGADPAILGDLVEGQEPFAVILGCSDSRAPVEMIFDQGLGDLFVIRVAGNIVAPSQVGSVEFAAAKFQTRLVVVLGHTQCGAITATLDEMRRPSEIRSRNLRSIVDRIRPALETLVEMDGVIDDDLLMRQAIRANVRASVNHLRHGSEILEELIDREGVMVIGAYYSLKTGQVEFFEDVP